MALLALTGVKAHAVSDDGAQVALAFTTKTGGEHSVMIPAECLDALIAGLNRAKSVAKNKQSTSGEQVSVTMPKTWMVTADVDVRGVVVVIFDPKTDNQIGYALDVESAKNMAVGLVKNAEAVLAKRHNKKTKS